MNKGPIDDWWSLFGAHVEIRQRGTAVCTGIVDDVTYDGRILWIHTPVDGRRLFDKSDSYEAWAADERLGFKYQMALG